REALDAGNTKSRFLRRKCGVEVTQERVDDVTVVVLHAKSLDAYNTKDFKRQVGTTMEPKAKVIMDLGQIEFIDSSGCGAILSYLRQLTQAGGQLKLCCVMNRVRSLFELVRLHRIVDIFNTREEAIKSYRV